MPITNRGKKWEMMNSLWIIWSFIFPFNSIGFFIIGFNTRNRKWKIIGGILLVTSGIILDYIAAILGTGKGFIAPIAIISYFVGIRLSLKYRVEYLVRRDVLLSNKISGYFGQTIPEKEISVKLEDINKKVEERIKLLENDEHRKELKKNRKFLILGIYSIITSPFLIMIPTVIDEGYAKIKEMTFGLIILVPGIANGMKQLEEVKSGCYVTGIALLVISIILLTYYFIKRNKINKKYITPTEKKKRASLIDILSRILP